MLQVRTLDFLDLGVGAAISGCFPSAGWLNDESSDGGALRADGRVSLTESDAPDKVERHDIATDWIAIVTRRRSAFFCEFFLPPNILSI